MVTFEGSDILSFFDERFERLQLARSIVEELLKGFAGTGTRTMARTPPARIDIFRRRRCRTNQSLAGFGNKLASSFSQLLLTFVFLLSIKCVSYLTNAALLLLMALLLLKLLLLALANKTLSFECNK